MGQASWPKSSRKGIGVYTPTTGKNRNRRMFLGGSGDGNEWIYVDGTSGVEVAYMSERASES